MSKSHHNFGALENVLTVIFFIITPLSLQWHSFSIYIWLAITLFFSRIFIKILIISVFSYYSGISFYKGVLTGLALSPMSICSILLLDQSFFVKLALNQELLVFSILILLSESVGPILTQYSLIKAKENSPDIVE
ncbi:MAG: hypothetical protein ACK5Z5_02275 [Neisseriaceae bacterium]